MLTPKGKLLADLVVYADADQLLVELDGALRDRIGPVLERHIIVDDVELTDVTDQSLETGVYGAGAAAAIRERLGVDVAELPPYHHRPIVGRGVGDEGLPGEVVSARVARNPWLGIPGFHVIGQRTLADLGVALSDEEAEVYRVEAGTPRYGVDMDEERLILEAHLEDAISMTKGCYLGQEVVARATSRGHIHRKLWGLILDGDAPAAAGAKVSAPAQKDGGHVTSSVISARVGAPIALAYLHRSLWEPGTEVAVEGGGQARRARVAALPFVVLA
jgi:folate-binding protein YgfZ